MSSLYFQICSLFYIILLNVIFFGKKRFQSTENTIFSYIIISNLFGVIIDLVSTYSAIINAPESILLFTGKLYLVYLLVWIMLMTAYIFSISLNKTTKLKKSFLFLSISALLSIVLIFALPLYSNRENGKIFTYGPSATVSYIISGICVAIWIIYMIKNFKNIKSKKYLPMFAYMTIGLFATGLQAVKPELLIITSMETFITVLMYFTIENPDMRLIEQLNIARDQAEKANNAKTEFLSNMSHEIRTPLNAIVGFSQALLEEDLPDSAKEEVKDIVMASDNLLDIVNGILDISKIEANKLEIINTEYRLEKILKELIILTKSRIGEKPIEFRTNFDPSTPEVLYGDHTRLKQIVLNILTNAAKYTKEGFIEFKISSVIKDDVCRLIISVEDSGIGIKPNKINSLFSKFDRLGVEEEITIEGTGLGLAITKKLVDLMGGKIVVQSVFGKGSKFTVAIDQKIIATKAPIKQEETTKQVETLDFKGKKILVVDDNKVNLKVADRLLRSYNVDVETVSSGQECIDKINNKEMFDLILMDDMMPKMSGTETLHELRKIDGFKIPVVALTANAISGMREKYLNEGFDEYLSKPIQKEELNQILIKFLNYIENYI